MYVICPIMLGYGKPLFGLAVIVIITLAPCGVGHNRLPITSLNAICWGECFSAVAIAMTIEPFRIGCHPLQGLHPAHGPSGDTQQTLDPEVIDQVVLDMDHVSDRDYREIEGVGLALFRDSANTAPYCLYSPR